MRVFILSTGRSGSTTIHKACEHIQNYTSSHESRGLRDISKKLDYPDSHIESDATLSWFLGTIDKKYDAVYVHLTRDPITTALSLMKRFHVIGWIMDSFASSMIGVRPEKLNRFGKWQISKIYITTITDNIEHFLKDKDSISIKLEDPEPGFTKLWSRIGAIGDFEAALNEFSIMHNSGQAKSKPLILWEVKLLAIRVWRRINN